MSEPTTFTDQQPRIATKADCRRNWGGVPNGRRFRCYLCGTRFAEGDVWRWVHAGKRNVVNFFTCDDCDGSDVLDRFVAANKELRRRFWWARS